MAKDKDQPETSTVAVSRDLAVMVKTIATHREITMLEVWDMHARAAVLREYRKVLNEMQRLAASHLNEHGGEG